MQKVLLQRLGYDETFIERGYYLIAHHHTYNETNGGGYQILVEADFLINIDKAQLDRNSIESIREKYLRQQVGYII
ncbi:MAG: hypothetical protein Q4Q00_07100 [Turicibacter sp.]|nr:hypothetical protein [Turicibacter sp.]